MTPWWQQPLDRHAGSLAKKLAKALALQTVTDVLEHLPRRYLNYTTPTDFASIEVGTEVTVVAVVMSEPQIIPMRSRSGSRVLTKVSDGSGLLTVVMFGRSQRAIKAATRQLIPGETVVLSGKATVYRGELQLTHPHISEPDEAETLWRSMHPLKPLYPAAGTVTSQQIENLTRLLVTSLPLAEYPDPVPENILKEYGLPSRADTFRFVHTPTNESQWRVARRRIAFEEAFITQAALLRRRALTRAQKATAYPAQPGKALAAFDAALPFTLTAGQVHVGAEFAREIASSTPMNRLLQGDVGSGKTLVALRAMLQVVDAGGQCALLAPTEVLASQHYQSLLRLLGPLAGAGQLGGAPHATQVAVITGAMSASQKRAATTQVASGAAGIVVGTHALLYDQVQFANLGLVVVDEQHRFGVDQRDALRAKGTAPHMMVMTATPIPRTVAMTVFGDLDVSVLGELPAGRQPVSTHIVPADNRKWVDRMWYRVAEEIRTGRQIFVVCPRIGDQEDSDDTAAVLDVAEELGAHPALAAAKIATLHGRMAAADKDHVMQQLHQGYLDVVVSTTVIEVGIDVPNATMMVIMDADRFGLSQLHQLRGRIGRGNHPGVCLLVTSAPPDSIAAQRLLAIQEHHDGFKLAEADTTLRREGNVLGAEQSGATSTLKVLEVFRDVELIDQARQAAMPVIDADPQLTAYPDLVAAIDRFLGEREEYLERS